MDVIWNYAVKDAWNFENGYNLTSHPSRLAKAIAHWELYKSIVGLPGEIVECGVFKGGSSIRFATFRSMLESSCSRKIICFDAFGAFPPSAIPEDAAFIEKFEQEAGQGIPRDELVNCFKHKGFDNYEFIQGDACHTVPQYVAKHAELRIALLHIDVDVYEPTRIILEQLFDRVVSGGLVVLDDYAIIHGETKAADEFLANCPKRYVLEKLPYYKMPVYLKK